MSSDSDDEPQQVDAAAYNQLQLSQALKQRDNRNCALQELNACLTLVFAGATKDAQEAMLQDVLQAVRCQDRRHAYRHGLSALLKTCERVLPKTRRQVVHAEHKAASLAARRAEQKAASRGVDQQEEEDSIREGDEMCEVLFDALPLPLVELVLWQLDPVSLANSACVSRCWRNVVQHAPVWLEWLKRTFGDAAFAQYVILAAGSTGVEAYGVFTRLAADSRRRLPWVSNRAILHGELTWLTREQKQQLWLKDPGNRGRRATQHTPIFCMPKEVVHWLLYRKAPAEANAEKSISSYSSSDEEAQHPTRRVQAVGRALKMWALVPPAS